MLSCVKPWLDTLALFCAFVVVFRPFLVFIREFLLLLCALFCVLFLFQVLEPVVGLLTENPGLLRQVMCWHLSHCVLVSGEKDPKKTFRYV